MRTILGSLLIFFLGTVPALAWQPSIAVNAGTQGAGITLGTAIIPGYLNLAAQGNYFAFNHGINTSDADYDGDLELATGGLLLKLFPFHGSFNLQAGAYYNANNISVTGVPKDPSIPGKLYGDVTFPDFAPYAGLGWGNTVNDGRITFTVDLGVMFQGTPDVGLSTTSANPAAIAHLRKFENELQDKVEDFQFYPVIRLGLAFKL